MTAICVNPFRVTLNATNVPICVADWAHTQLQLVYATYAWIVLLCIAIAWTIVSRYQRKRLRKEQIGFSLKLRQWARTNRQALILTRPIQLLVSCWIVFLVGQRCASFQVELLSYNIQTALYLFCVCNDVIRFLATRYKILFCFSFLTILEICCLISHVYVRYAPELVIDNVRTRSWLDFSLMRPVFILSSYREMEAPFPVTCTRNVMLLRLFIRFFLMILSGACIIFYFESLKELPALRDSGFTHLYTCTDSEYVTNTPTELCAEETWSVMYSFYFTIVTLGTVGYGDNAPKTVMARFLVILFILLGVLLFSNEIENLIRLYQLRQIGNPPYAPKFQHSKHIVIAGNPTFAQLTAILREIMHEDHIDAFTLPVLGMEMRIPLHFVILAEKDAKCVKELVQKLKMDSLFAARVTFVAGDVARREDLERAHASSAIAALIVSDKLAMDAGIEDSFNIMRVLAIRRHCGPQVRCIALVRRAESVCHMLAAGLHPDDVICEHVIKMGALAQSALAPGMSTMLANLASSLSFSLSEASGSNEKSKNDFPSHLSDRIVPKALTNTFEREYLKGITKEIYQIRLSLRFCGLTFAQATANIFKESMGHVILIAVQVTSNRRECDALEDDGCVLLSPGNDLIVLEWMVCFVIAEDMALISQFGVNASRISNMEETIIAHEYANDNREDDHMPFISLWTPSVHKSLDAPSPVSEPFHVSMSVSLENLVMERTSRSWKRQIMQGHAFASQKAYPNDQNASFETNNVLGPPPLDVLVQSNHIVVCSFLGEEALSSLCWFILPLRLAHAIDHPSITILDAAEPSPLFSQSLQAFDDIVRVRVIEFSQNSFHCAQYYIQGSPLVYSDLQRAGAKAASTVIILSKGTTQKEFGSLRTSICDQRHDQNAVTSISDAEVILCSLLIELKMDFSRIFTITELVDESNSKFLGMSFRLQQWQKPKLDANAMASQAQFPEEEEPQEDRSIAQFWNTMLSNGTVQRKSETAIFKSPLYMSGRLLHPEFCENMLAQTFYSPAINKIVQQLVGGGQCTGTVRMYRVPAALWSSWNRFEPSFADVYYYFAQTLAFPGVCIGVYRESVQTLNDEFLMELPIVLTAPEMSLQMHRNDRIYVLFGITTLSKAASVIQKSLCKRGVPTPREN